MQGTVGAIQAGPIDLKAQTQIEKVKKLTYDELGVILNYPVEAD